MMGLGDLDVFREGDESKVAAVAVGAGDDFDQINSERIPNIYEFPEILLPKDHKG